MTKFILLFTVLFALNSFSQSGQIDTAFGENGKVTTGLGSNNNSANAVVVQSDGKTIVGGKCQTFEGGSHFALARYNTDGTLDNSYGIKGKIVSKVYEVPFNKTQSTIYSISLLADDKILVVGSYGFESSVSGTVIARYNNDGTIDYTFGSNGTVFSDYRVGYYATNRVVFQQDGKFIIALEDANVNLNISNFGLERYTYDGVLDTTFGTNGKISTSFVNGKCSSPSIAIMQNGKFIVAGSYYTQNGNSSLAVSKYNIDGTLDTSFDNDGKIIMNFGQIGGYNYPNQVFISSNDKITIIASAANSTGAAFGLMQFNSNGSLDTTFDGDGKALSFYDDSYSGINSVIKQPDGKFIITNFNSNFSSTTDFVTRRYNSDVSLDTTFGLNGKIITTIENSLNESKNVILTSDSKIIVVGNSNNDFGIAKYNSNGTLDTTFDTDGKVTTKFEKGNDKLANLLVLPDDKFITVGTSQCILLNGEYFLDIVLSKHNSDGTLDTSFGNSGKVLSNFPGNLNTILTSVSQPDGKILISNQVNNYSTNELIRYNANGSLDTSFGTNGKINTELYSNSMVIQPNGKIIIAGTDVINATNYVFKVKRYNSNGTIDTGFDQDGTATFSYGNNPSNPALLLQSDGKIILSASVLFASTAFISIRINTNGSLDNTFGVNGIATTTIGSYCYIYKNILQTDGKLVVIGNAIDAGFTYLSTVRYNTNGTIDTNYGLNGVTTLGFDSYNIINSIFLQSDNKILIALSQYNPTENANDFKIKRLNPDGTYDNDFGGQEGITTSFFSGYDEAFSIGLQSDNKIIIAGSTNNSINDEFALVRLTNSVLSLDSFNNDATNLLIYPNPTSNNLFIKTLNEIDIQEYTIYNLLGQAVFKREDKNLIIDTKSFSNGIYILQIKTNKGIVNRKFIKE